MNRNDHIEAGTRIRVLPGYTACNGDSTPQNVDQIWVDAHRNGGIFYIATSQAPDSDGDYRVSSDAHRQGTSKYVHHDFVQLAPEGGETVSINDALQPGNEIEFSVEGVELTDHGLRVGCKFLDFTQQEAWNAIVKLDTVAKTATFRAIVNPSGIINVPGGGFIERWEATNRFKDIKITKLGTPPRPDVTITLTAEENDKLVALVGVGRGNPSLYRKLWGTEGYENLSSTYRVNFDGSGSYTITKR